MKESFLNEPELNKELVCPKEPRMEADKEYCDSFGSGAFKNSGCKFRKVCEVYKTFTR